KMKSRIFILTVAYLTVFGPANSASAQTSQSKPLAVPIAKTVPVTREEQIVRATYEKLINLNQKSQFPGAQAFRREDGDDDNLRFELTSFRIGPIQAIMSTLRSAIATLPSGEIILLTRSTTRVDNQEEQVSYRAAWTNGQYASVYDPSWTVADVLGFEPARYSDVGEYAAYEVTVYFRGKSRNYRALALFHNSYQSS